MNTMSEGNLDKGKITEMALKIKNFGSNTINGYGGEKVSDDQAKNQYQSFPLDEYKELCEYFLGDLNLTEEFIQKRLEFFLNDRDLTIHLPAGSNVCIAPVPLSENGFPLTSEEIKNGYFLRTLVLDEYDQAERGFSSEGGNIFKALPLEVRQNLVFKVPVYPSLGNPQLTPEEKAKFSLQERKNLVALMEEKIRAALKLFS